MPLFSIIMATYNRSRHILPSIHSVLQQTVQDFELIIVGDACTDDTAKVLEPYLGDKVRWLNLAHRTFSQSGPNNEGIRNAGGRYISYIGHDDVWGPDHLQALLGVFESDDACGFVVSGAIYHMPPGIEWAKVTGIFEQSDAALRQFFPPSSFAHQRNLTHIIGNWRMPYEIKPPVDSELLLRAVSAGIRFVSTGCITVHKFAAGYRYLSYLQHESWEQEEILSKISSAGYTDFIAVTVDLAIRTGGYLSILHEDYEVYQPGQLARANAARKGLFQHQPSRLETSSAVLDGQPDQYLSLDWQPRNADGIRWAHMNPRPKILIPFSHDAPVSVQAVFSHHDPASLLDIVVRRGADRLPLSIIAHQTIGHLSFAVARWVMSLAPDAMSLLELELSASQRSYAGFTGLGYAMIIVDPDTENIDLATIAPDIQAFLAQVQHYASQ